MAMRPSRVSKHSWLAVVLVEPPFPLAVGFFVRLGWTPSLTRPPQLQGFLPSMKIGNFWPVGFSDLWLSVLFWNFHSISMVFSGYLLVPASRFWLFWTFYWLYRSSPSSMTFRVFLVSGYQFPFVPWSHYDLLPPLVTLLFGFFVNLGSGPSAQSSFHKKPCKTDADWFI